MSVALYARVSTVDQNAETQLAQLRQYCEARGWKVHAEYVDTASGATSNRPRLDAMMKDAAGRKFNGVLVWKFDRLFRSTQHMLDALDRFRTLGINFVSVTESIDTSTAMGQMVFTLLAAIAQFERSLTIERTQIGMARARSAGKRFGRPRMAITQKQAEDLYAGGKGLSQRAIAAQLGCSPAKICQLLREAV